VIGKDPLDVIRSLELPLAQTSQLRTRRGSTPSFAQFEKMACAQANQRMISNRHAPTVVAQSFVVARRSFCGGRVVLRNAGAKSGLQQQRGMSMAS